MGQWWTERYREVGNGQHVREPANLLFVYNRPLIFGSQSCSTAALDSQADSREGCHSRISVFCLFVCRDGSPSC